MPDDPKQNSLTSALKTRFKAQGDIPDSVKHRYYPDERGGKGLGFYRDAQALTPVFRDRGHELVTDRFDPIVIRDMAAIARHRNWVILTARGSAQFRQEAWLAGRSIGLEVRGYRAAEPDLQALERRMDRTARGGQQA